MLEIKFSQEECVKLVQYGSKEYNAIINLRYEILRKPLNLNFTSEQLAAEKDFYHIGYYLNEELIACLMLVPEENKKMKMKQVAVKQEFQGKGIGAKLVLFAEKFAMEKGKNNMYCNARETAIPFYIKLNYKPVGAIFEEVSIPHQQLEKQLA